LYPKIKPIEFKESHGAHQPYGTPGFKKVIENFLSKFLVTTKKSRSYIPLKNCFAITKRYIFFQVSSNWTVSKCCQFDEIFNATTNACENGNFSYDQLQFYQFDNDTNQLINVEIDQEVRFLSKSSVTAIAIIFPKKYIFCNITKMALYNSFFVNNGRKKFYNIESRDQFYEEISAYLLV